jgi:hypothetical protein
LATRCTVKNWQQRPTAATVCHEILDLKKIVEETEQAFQLWKEKSATLEALGDEEKVLRQELLKIQNTKHKVQYDLLQLEAFLSG